MKRPVYNFFKESLTGKELKYKDPTFGKFENGIPVTNWTPENEDVDANGFDKRFSFGFNGHTVEVTLPVGTKLARFGSDFGRVMTKEGTPYEYLGMPFDIRTIEYHTYRVTKPLEVTMGIVAPMFDSVGGGIQFNCKERVADLCEKGFLEEII